MNKRLFFVLVLNITMQICYSKGLNSIFYNNVCYISSAICVDTIGSELNSSAVRLEYKSTAVSDDNIARYDISPFVTTHFVSPEPILYVDISSQNVEGDLPAKNILRIKPDSAVYAHGGFFQITIITQSYLATYRLNCSSGSITNKSYVITVNPAEALRTDSRNNVSQQEFEGLCLKALSHRRSIRNISSKHYGMEMWTSNIFIAGDYLIFDIGAKNKTKLQYKVDELKFRLQDKYAVNAAVSQEIELKPVYQLYPTDGNLIKGKWHNLYIFKKFTFPNEKVFQIEITESPISGRKVEMNIDYNQVLQSQLLQ